jgi:uncharacterized protein YoxC
MQSLLKTVVAAATVGTVFVGAVIFYVNYKIDQVTQAITAPMIETRDRVDGAVESLERSVTSVVESGADAVDDLAGKVDEVNGSIDEAVSQLSERVDAFGDGVSAVVGSSTERFQRTVDDTWGTMRQMWQVTTSE